MLDLLPTIGCLIKLTTLVFFPLGICLESSCNEERKKKLLMGSRLAWLRTRLWICCSARADLPSDWSKEYVDLQMSTMYPMSAFIIVWSNKDALYCFFLNKGEIRDGFILQITRKVFETLYKHKHIVFIPCGTQTIVAVEFYWVGVTSCKILAFYIMGRYSTQPYKYDPL